MASAGVLQRLTALSALRMTDRGGGTPAPVPSLRAFLGVIAAHPGLQLVDAGEEFPQRAEDAGLAPALAGVLRQRGWVEMPGREAMYDDLPPDSADSDHVRFAAGGVRVDL